MKINNVEFDIDFTDADILQKINDGAKKVSEKSSKLDEEELTDAEVVLKCCIIIKEFFDYVLGDGTSEKIFGNKNSLKLCLKAFDDILDAKEEQFKQVIDDIDKYSPNRLIR